MLGDDAVVHHDDLVGQVDDALLVRDDHQGGLLFVVELAEGVGEPGEGPQVDAGLRLVEDHEAGVPGQDGGDLDALDLAAGEGGVHLSVDIVVGAQPHPGEVLAFLLVGEPLPAGGELQQVPDLQTLEPGRLLKAVADALPGPLGDVEGGDVLPVPEDLTAGGGDQAHDGLGQGGLAAAVGAGDDHELVRADGEGDIVEDAQLLAGLVGHLIG